MKSLVIINTALLGRLHFSEAKHVGTKICLHFRIKESIDTSKPEFTTLT